ncbi:cilia- and flagella-associated protein 47 isoform X2 [Ornithorhynchus anatinus]|uniref:cilia- and flagella-associated protein 47 isoform X2 n=1 Tax=Ornithorhynchus anatinus TaxID=9258 RepID=UPI0010A8951B|nr:cilia- and flagella-associated protein 47 isoform X2 [Ornithorhynchus anatinus]
MEEGAERSVRVSPSRVRFSDVRVGQLYRAALTVQNVGRSSKAIRFQGPRSQQFKLIVTDRDKAVASGLQMTATVEYRPDNEEDVFDRIFVLVEKEVIEVPLIGLIPCCQLEIEPKVNFGTLIANSIVICKEIHVTNHGSAPGAFHVEYKGNLPIFIQPTGGIVGPKLSEAIKVDICTDLPRVVNEVAKVRLQGCEDTFLRIEANVVEQVIELLNVYDDKLECVSFGSVFFGTSKTEQAVLYNKSPEPVMWVAVLEDDAVGEELGIDLQKNTDAALQDLCFLNRTRDVDVTALISCFPNQGTLLPYQKTVVTLCFSPKQLSCGVRRNEPSSRQDYVLFLRFEAVGSKDGFLKSSNGDQSSNNCHRVELAVTGSGLPVLLNCIPGRILNFVPCYMGESSEIFGVLKNESDSLPVIFNFHKIAHFKTNPEKGKIEIRNTQDVQFSFVPHQVGIFKVKQVVDIIGSVATEDNSPCLKMKPFHQIHLCFTGVCRPITKKIELKIHPGLAPLTSNTTGQAFMDEMEKYKKLAPVAILQAAQTKIHSHQRRKDSKNVLIAFPNDRSGSIRSGERYKTFRTVFTNADRYNYVDPSFAYTHSEEIKRKANQDIYFNYIQSLRNQRQQKEKAREFILLNNAIDIGIKPAAGLKPPRLSVAELHEEELKPKPSPLKEDRLLSTRNLAAKESWSLTREISDGLNAEPFSPQEKEDCSFILTPKQLHQIIIGPSVIDFGEVCVHSTSVRQLHVVNNLSLHIWVQLETEVEELQRTSRLSQVLPPMSSTFIPIVFESNKLGKFRKCFTFTVNRLHTGHVLVIAEAMSVALELSTTELILRPTPGSLANTEFRGTVRLYNRRNYSAEFSWKPVNTQKGIAFSIRPAEGIVEAYADLECEVVWHPAFSSPERGEFDLYVHRGNTVKLRCIAKLGHTSVQFLEQRILFNNTPQGLTTCKKAFLLNTGHHHAYFKVCEVNPLPILTITPSNGVIPVGGRIALKVYCTSKLAIKFDTRVKVAVRHGKILEFRIGGAIEIPNIYINLELFNFQGVYVGSTQVVPFVIQNEGSTRARVEFDLSKYKDFALDFKDQAVVDYDPSFPFLYSVELLEKMSLECGLSFSPKEVAAYDFALPVKVNLIETSICQSHRCPSPYPVKSEKQTVVPRSQKMAVTPFCTVQATVLQPPLRLSSSEFSFELPLKSIQLGSMAETQKFQTLTLKNTSKQKVTWNLDIDHMGKRMKDSTFRFNVNSGSLEPGEENSIIISFCPTNPGTYTAEVPMHLNDNPANYRVLRLTGAVKSPRLTFDPPFVILTPVPLGMKTGRDVYITPLNYYRCSKLQVHIPEVDLENGDKINPLSVNFPNDQVIEASPFGTSAELLCHISFESARPVSFLVTVDFVDEDDSRFSLQVAAAAENCILTVYPYMALHCLDHKIILRSDQNGASFNLEEAALHQSYTPRTVSTSTSASSRYDLKNPVYEESVAGAESTTCKYVQMSDRVVESRRLSKEDGRGPRTDRTEKQRQLSFPHEDTEEYIYFQKVVSAVQTWFSLFGWPKGPNPISIPQSLRSDVYKLQFASSDKKGHKQDNFAKYNKTIYDMLLYLSGQLLPGISANQSIPYDDTERVRQLHCQHRTLLTFLKVQGAFLPYVLPEFLFEPEDYKKWVGLRGDGTTESEKSAHIPEQKYYFVVDDGEFETLSKRVWTDVLLQTYKVLILCRVSPANCSNRPSADDVTSVPRINPDTLSSNIYSPPEKFLLTWMNTQYENTRKIIWKDCQKGDVPPMRWIINFDKDLLDGLVLAAQMAAYCPFLIPTHFVKMYTNPSSPEQCLHNCLIVVQAFHAISLTMDVQATDICDPNPIMMLMLCVFMYERLPHYLPKKTVEFSGPLHATIFRQVRLKNPSTKSLVYNAAVVGIDSADFSLPKGNTVMMAPKSQVIINLKFTSRFIRPTEATLLLVPKTSSGMVGTTVTFSLKTEVLSIEPLEIVKCKSPCYELKEINVDIKNPFKTGGEFRVLLVESSTFLSKPSHLTEVSQLNQDTQTSYETILNTTRHEYGSHNQDTFPQTSNQSGFLKEFFCPVKSLFLEAESSSVLDIYFLPFDLQKRYCGIILSNKEIGEFLCMVEGTSTIPLASHFLTMDSPNVLQIINNAAESNKTAQVLYLKCGLHETLEENLKIPLVNEARERALAIAAQQQMSDLEYERRKVTGTLESSSVRVAIAVLGLSGVEAQTLHMPSKYPKKVRPVSYTVEVSMPEHFQVPSKLSIPQFPKSRANSKATQQERYQVIKNSESDGAFVLPIKFVPLHAGRYPCQILLQSTHDIRVYALECVVNTDIAETDLEFVTSACEALIQDIPINNRTSQDWKCQAILEGKWFYGPPMIYVGPGETTQYPLMFKPIFECETEGKLTLQNETDGTEHIFGLKGTGKKPLALDHVVIDCQVRQMTHKVLMVPNYTKSRLTYQVTTDLPMVGGAPTIILEPGEIIPYTLHIYPWKRGITKGAVSFVVEDGKRQRSPYSSSPEETDGEREPQNLSAETLQTVDSANSEKEENVSNFQVWFSLEINSAASPPEKTLEVKCAALDTIGIEIPITNPTDEVLHFDVLLMDTALNGATKLMIKPKETVAYVAEYSPAMTGYSDGSIIFQSDVVGEFWYALKLTAKKPTPMKMPELQCDLGKWVVQMIPLVNRTHETLELEFVNSNPGNFLVEIKQKLIVPPRSTTEVPVRFCPSALGKANHQTAVIFKCPQFKEWIFYLSGVGLIPQPMEPASISSRVGHHSSVIISFRNPTLENVLVDVLLTDQDQIMHHLNAAALRRSVSKESVFCLPLKQMQGIPLSPRGKLDIPVLFKPDIMKLYEGLVVVHMVKANGENWPYSNLAELNTEMKSITRARNGEIRGIRWIYPIHGIPEAPPSKSAPTVISCKARRRVEERMEVLLTGVVPGGRAVQEPRDFVVRPKNLTPKLDTQTRLQIAEGYAPVDEFLYEIKFESEITKSSLESCVALYLIKKDRDVNSGIITLIFNIVFAPQKPMRIPAVLEVQCRTGGVWNFPLTLVATAPDVDDVINIEAVGLFKEAVVGFRLTSQTRCPEPFSAFFLPGSAPEFSVVPRDGELLPLDTAGTWIRVGFSPKMYGRKHTATLVIQTATTRWMYEINGLPPQSEPPGNVKAKVVSTDSRGRPAAGHQRNFLRENVKLITTGVSSPIKGAPLVLRTK